MWDITNHCWNVSVDHYQEALRLMTDYTSFHRGVKISTIP
jgi:hypothetical protein